MIKRILKDVSGYALGTLVVLLVLEFTLSFFPVNSAIRTELLNSEASPFDVAAKKDANFSFSTMWNFINPQWRKTNNLGFFSDYDYEENFEGYIIVGDSQVEAVQVPFSETFHQQIANKLEEKVYNIGLSGAPLSQYHAYTNEICERYQLVKLL